MHNWGDEGVDWNGIEAAAWYINSFCRRWGRLGGQAKEKYGTVRFYCTFGNLCLHTLVYPGYVFNQFPKWLWNLDCDYIGPVLNGLFGRLFCWYQQKVYARAYLNALNRWPHLRAEILRCADHLELIPGVTRVDGKKLHVLDSNGEVICTWESL